MVVHAQIASHWSLILQVISTAPVKEHRERRLYAINTVWVDFPAVQGKQKRVDRR
jgi:hypothetical protein